MVLEQKRCSHIHILGFEITFLFVLKVKPTFVSISYQWTVINFINIILNNELLIINCNYNLTNLTV